MSEFERIETGLGEECGVFGAYDMDGGDVASSVYYGLFALQHRGQESCGIAVTDTYGKRKVLQKKGLGQIKDVFDEEELDLSLIHILYEPGEFHVMIGPNSRDVKTTSFELK